VLVARRDRPGHKHGHATCSARGVHCTTTASRIPTGQVRPADRSQRDPDRRERETTASAVDPRDSVRNRRDDSDRDQAVEHQLNSDRRNQETEDLLRDQHAILVELRTDPVRPAEHHHVQQ
jgi:hypothetical protein